MPDPSPRLQRILLLAGLAAGIIAAASGLLVGGDDALPEQAVARVNDRLILRDAWLRAVAAVSSERRTPLTEADRRHILDRLVDEELLVQHGIALGLVEQDRRLRGQLVSDVLMSVRAEQAEPDEAALRRFYEDNRDFFTPPARLRVAAWRVAADGARQPYLPPLPDALLPPAELRSYLGPTLTRAALELRPGETLQQQTAQGRVALELLAREPGQAPAFETVRAEVEAEYRRRADEAAVRQLLEDLRRSQRVILAPELP